MAIKRWTDEEIAILRKEYPKGGAKGVSAILTDRCLYQIKHKAENLGIKTTAFADALVERKGSILEFIRRSGECTRREIEEAFSLSRKRVEFALNELSKTGTIIFSRELKSWIFTGKEDQANSAEDRLATGISTKRNYRRNEIDDSKFITDDDLEWMQAWRERAEAKNELRQRYLEQKSTENQLQAQRHV